MLNFVTTDYLTDGARMIREEVFVKEQKFCDEFDDIDNEACCMTVYEEELPIACCRFFKGHEQDEYVLGRLAILKSYRGKGLGEEIIRQVEKIVMEMGGKKLSLSAQVRAKGFYEKQGFQEQGNIYYEEYCKHIHMVKKLVS
ncbi:MAG: GNAT family N-acetyltransferase [Lachnospiraceae bacterium]|nr:GNAT family N-acetyltransferase [Lachnospiraceae bacterium]